MCDTDDDNCCPVRTGAQGDVGYQGESGMRGYQGDVGYQSQVVVIGNQGPQGVAGPGLEGPLGNLGLQGPSLRGLDGAQGPQGFASTDGPQGVSGERGNQGFEGLAEQGIQGLQGYQGLDQQGTRGFQGSQGLVNQGPQGAIGPIMSLTITTYDGLQSVAASSFGALNIVNAANVGAGTYVVIFDGAVQCPPNGASYTIAQPGSACNQIVMNTGINSVYFPVSLQSRITTPVGPTNVGPNIIASFGAPPAEFNVKFLVQIIQIA